MSLAGQLIQATKVSPLVAFLILAVITPAIGVLWFMFNSIDNERLATLKKLELFHEQQTRLAINEFESYWHNLVTSLSSYSSENANIFPIAVSKAFVSSALIFDNQDRMIYPNRRTDNKITIKQDASWPDALKAEHQQQEYRRAESIYKQISRRTHGQEKRLAQIAAARNLEKQNEITKSIALLISIFEGVTTIEPDERNLSLDAGLRALQFAARNRSRNQNQQEGIALNINKLAKEIQQRVNDYSIPLSSQQRLFIMHQLTELSAQHNINFTLPTFEAEMLSQEIAKFDSKEKILNNWKNSEFIPISTVSSSIILVAKKAELEKHLAQFFASPSNKYVHLSITSLRHSDGMSSKKPIYNQNLRQPFDGYSLSLLSDTEPNQTIKEKQRYYSYLATSALVILVLIASSSFVAYRMRKQERLNQLKSDVMSTVSHELRTPLSSIRILVDNLLEDKQGATTDDQDQLYEYIQIISDENERLTRLVNNFLEFSRIDRGIHHFDLRYCKIEDFIRPAIQYFQHRLEHEEVKFSMTDELHGDVWADEQKMTIVLVNLLENALKYSTSPKKIELVIREDKNYYYLSITDSGIGISEKDLKKVFEQFYRVDQALSRSTEGCGLGLYISSRIVEGHDGKLSVSSKLGSGSTFTISLPKPQNS